MMTTAIKVLMSSDGILGVAFVSNSSIVADPGASIFPQRNDDVLGTCVIFPLPSPSTQRVAKSIRCSNVRIGGWSSHTWRNLLWPTRTIPLKSRSMSHNGKEATDSCSLVCQSYVRSNYGYIVFNDEDDGFRIFWVDLSPTSADIEEVVSISSSELHQRIRPKRRDIIVAPDESLVTQVISDSLSGETGGVHNSGDDSGQQVHIAFEAYLHVDALLCDILKRRKNLFSTSGNSSRDDDRGSVGIGDFRLPPFFYNLVSISDDGRTVTLVIAFSHPCFVNSVENDYAAAETKRTAAAIALFVDLDLFDQSYSESGWVQHESRHDPDFLEQWSNTLAMNRRMIEMRVGAFCVGDAIISRSAKCLHSFGVNTHESNCKQDDSDDTDVDLWRPYVLNKLKGKNMQAPKKVAMSSLYPFCDVISNKAVTSYQPVPEITCRDFPIRLCYG